MASQRARDIRDRRKAIRSGTERYNLNQTRQRQASERQEWKRRQLQADRAKRCGVCGLRYNKGKRMPTVDHIIPLCKGGPDKPSNWQIMCLKCNQAKRSKIDYRTNRVDPTRC